MSLTMRCVAQAEMLAACGADPCYRDLDVGPAVNAFHSMVRQACTALLMLAAAGVAFVHCSLQRSFGTACHRGVHLQMCSALLLMTTPFICAFAQRRCQCPLEVVDTVRRIVGQLVDCVDREPDTMLVLRRRRSISGSLGTAAKPNYKKALPLLRAVAALVRVLHRLAPAWRVLVRQHTGQRSGALEAGSRWNPASAQAQPRHLHSWREYAREAPGYSDERLPVEVRAYPPHSASRPTCSLHCDGDQWQFAGKVCAVALLRLLLHVPSNSCALIRCSCESWRTSSTCC